VMIDKGMEITSGMLQGLIDKADARIAEIKSGEQPALKPDDNAKYLRKSLLIWMRSTSR